MLGEILTIINNITLALSFVLNRKIEDKASPIFQNMVRNLIPTIIFGLICISSGFIVQIYSIPWWLYLYLIVGVTFLTIIGDTTYLQSQKYIGSTKAISITTTTPFFTILFSIIFLERPISISLILSGFLIGIGVLISNRQLYLKKQQTEKEIIEENSKLVNSSKSQVETHNILKGVILALFTAIMWSLGFVFTDYSFNKVNEILGENLLSTILALLISLGFAALVLGIFTGVGEIKHPQPKSSKTWKILIIAGLIGNFIGGITYGEGIRLAGAPFMSLITIALPLFTLPFSYLINKEKISKFGLIGLFFTMIGVLVVLIM